MIRYYFLLWASMKPYKIILLNTITCLCFTESIFSQALEEQIETCSQIEVSLIRLQCFDRISKPQDKQTQVVKKESRFRLLGRNRESRRDSKKSSVVNKTEENSDNESNKDTTVEITGNSENEFGQETLPPIETIDKVISRIIGEFQGWSGNTKFELENGQVWQQSGNGILSVSLKNPKVTIKKGVLKSYTLKIEGVNSSVKVRRIK